MKRFTDFLEDSGTIQHHQFQKSAKHAQQHAVTHIDKDSDSDVDKFDKDTPDEVTGTEPKEIQKKIANKEKGEKKHAKVGVSFK